MIPYARSISPIAQSNWEGTGVVPDVPTKAANALNTAHRLALQTLLAGADDESQKAHLRSVIDALPSQ